MSTSFAGGPIPYDETEHAAQQPLSVDVAQTLINNALSFADQAGQVRAWWESPAPTTIYMEPRAFGDVDDFHKITELGPFPLLIREDGAPYACRVRIAGYSTQAQTVTFRLKLSPAGTPFTDLFGGPLARPEIAMDITTNATSHAWLSPAQTLLSPTTADTIDALGHLTTFDEIGGVRVTVAECLFTLAIYGSTTNVTAAPRLTGFHLAEYHVPA